MARQSTHHLYRRKRNRGGYIEILYYVRFVDWKGTRRVFPAGTDYPIAKHLRDELLARNQLRYDFDEVPKKTIGFSTWVDDCLEAKKTKRAHRNYVETSLKPKEYFKSESIDSITAERTDDFKKWRYGQNTQYGKPPKPATVNRDVALIKMALRRAFDLGKITKLPSISLDRENNRRNRVASQSEFEKICQGMPSFAREVIVILYDQGMRISEGCGLLRSNIKLEREILWHSFFIPTMSIN